MIRERLKRTIQGSRARASAIQADPELLSTLKAAIGNNDSQLIRVRPPREHDGIENAVPLLDAVHQIKERGLMNRMGVGGHTHAFEIWYDEGKVQFYIRPERQADVNQFTRQLYSNYDNVAVEEVPQTFEHSFPEINDGDYIAGAEIKTTRQFWYPLRSNQPNNKELTTDPYGTITSEMVVEEDVSECGERVGPEDYRMLIQVVFTPARSTWARGLPFGANVHKKAIDLKENDPDSFYTPGTKEKKAAKIIEEQQSMPGFYTTIRVIGISKYEDIAQDRVGNAGEVFDLYDNQITNQALYPQYRGKTLKPFVKKTAERTHSLSLKYRLSRRKQIMNKYELGGLVHLPNEDINTPMVDWARMDSGPGVPADAEKVNEGTTKTTIQQERAAGSGDQPIDAFAQQGAGSATGDGQQPSDAHADGTPHPDPTQGPGEITYNESTGGSERPVNGARQGNHRTNQQQRSTQRLPNPEAEDSNFPTTPDPAQADRQTDHPYPKVMEALRIPSGHAWARLREQ